MQKALQSLDHRDIVDRYRSLYFFPGSSLRLFLRPGSRLCRLPELPRPYSAESDPIQRLLAFAYLQTQKTHWEAEEELRKDADTLSAVLAAQGQIAAPHLDLEQSLEFIAEGARRLTGAGGAAIALREGQKVVCRGRSGLIAPELGACLSPESGVCGAPEPNGSGRLSTIVSK